jgi:hypothetical protein
MRDGRIPLCGAGNEARANIARLSVPSNLTGRTTGRVKKHFHLCGATTEQLERRLAVLRCALSLRHGVIVRIKWRPSLFGREGRVTVHYELPRASLRASDAAKDAPLAHGYSSAHATRRGPERRFDPVGASARSGSANAELRKQVHARTARDPSSAQHLREPLHDSGTQTLAGVLA